MPVIKRLVQPIHANCGEIPKGSQNELEAYAVNSLSSVILQLSSLAKHAESIFAELFNEATSIHQRTVSAQERLEHLSIKVTKLDSNLEERMTNFYFLCFCTLSLVTKKRSWDLIVMLFIYWNHQLSLLSSIL